MIAPVGDDERAAQASEDVMASAGGESAMQASPVVMVASASDERAARASTDELVSAGCDIVGLHVEPLVEEAAALAKQTSIIMKAVQDTMGSDQQLDRIALLDSLPHVVLTDMTRKRLDVAVRSTKRRIQAATEATERAHTEGRSLL